MNKVFNVFFILSAIVLVLTVAFVSYGQDADATLTWRTSPTAANISSHDWGQSIRGINALQISVAPPHSLTNTKTGLVGWIASNFEQSLRKLSPEGKKAIQSIWIVPGVQNINYSSYSLLIEKANLWTWPEVEKGIYTAMDTWFAEVEKAANKTPTKPPAKKAE